MFSVSCSYGVNVNQLNPCFNIKWKSIGWLSIICLTLNLSHNLTGIDFGKLIPLNVTLTSFQSISKTSHT